MKVPSPGHLADIERRFSVAFPAPFVAFCRRYVTVDPLATYAGLRRGVFIADLPTFEAISAQIRTKEWGLLPFFFDQKKKTRKKSETLADCIHGFSIEQPGSDEVMVWSVHTLVHGYPSFDAWLDAYRK